MKSEYNKLTVDAIGSAAKPWSACREQLCRLGMTPFVLMYETARSAP